MLPERFFSPPKAAKILEVNSDKVLAWIKSGELVAVNVAANANGERPRWRISEDELGKFLLRRRHAASVDIKPTRRRRSQAAPTTRYFT